MIQHLTVRLSIIIMFCIFSPFVSATLNGTFTGMGSTTFDCTAPVVGSTNETISIELIANGTTFTLNLTGATNKYNFSGGGGISQSGSTFTFNTSGTATFSGVSASLDGPYTSLFNFSYQFDGNKLTLLSDPPNEFISAGSPCSGLNIDVTLTNLAGTSQTIISEETSGSTVTDAVLFNTQIQNTILGISTRIASTLTAIRNPFSSSFSDRGFQLQGQTGLNAGNEVSIPYGIWGSYSYTDYENDLSTTAFDGSSHGFLGGIDFAYWDNSVLGIAIGYENADIDTTFNGGEQQTDVVTVSPYFGAILTDNLSVDFNLGYSNVDYDQFRQNGGTRVTSSPNSDRWFGALNLNTFFFVDRWVLGGRVGTLFASSKIDEYTESDGTQVGKNRTKVSTINIATDVAYSFNQFEPFASLAYQYDYQLRKISTATAPQPANDVDDLLMILGIRYFNKSGVTGNLEYSKRFLRENFDEDRLSLTIRIDI